MSKDLSLYSRRVILAGERKPCEATVHVRDGKIASIDRGDKTPGAEDLGDLAILPGIVDTHAHINEPGRTEWEGFKTATRAAAAGGITTVIDMPLNSIPATTSLAALQTKTASAQAHCSIDYGFWGGVIPGNAGELEAMIRAGIFGFKAFMCPSGVSEFPMSEEDDLRQAMKILVRHGVPLLVHAELESPTASSGGSPRTYRSYLESRPSKWEVEAIRLLIELAQETRCRTHVVHLSACEALPELLEARKQGVPITAETCPHYLTFAAEKIPDGSTEYKCAPPIRSEANRQRLWQALHDGEIEFVVSDHSPCTPGLKLREMGDFQRAWGGIAGLQFSLPAVWTELRERQMGLADLSRLMSFNTARFLSLAGRKGALSPGADADLIVFDPEAESTLEPSQVLHRHNLTPYSGRKIAGRIERTYLRGQCIYNHSAAERFPTDSQPIGLKLERPRALPPGALPDDTSTFH